MNSNRNDSAFPKHVSGGDTGITKIEYAKLEIMKSIIESGKYSLLTADDISFLDKQSTELSLRVISDRLY